mgnify:CR=1 FL=1
MKTTLMCTLAIAAVLFAQPASAQDHPMPANSAMQMGMGKPAQEMPMAGKPGTDMTKPASKIQAEMEKMQQQMDKIMATTDPKIRQKLLQEHMETMQSSMKAMRDMQGSSMKGSAQPGGKSMGSMKDKDMQNRQEMTETRMNMMQMMMDQMMQRDKAMNSMPHM